MQLETGKGSVASDRRKDGVKQISMGVIFIFLFELHRRHVLPGPAKGAIVL